MNCSLAFCGFLLRKTTPKKGGKEGLSMDEITQARDYLLGRCHPSKIIVYDQRVDKEEHLLSAALCIVAEIASPRALERELRGQVPFPIRLTAYRPQEWSFLVRQEDTQARRLCQTGQVLYEQTWC